MSERERFWSKVKKSDGCWEWQAGKSRDGYGVFVVGTHRNHTNWRAHRYSWALANGPIPDGANILHRCDNPACVRPDHLFVGTANDNNQDMLRKGRQVRGAAHGRSKLTEEGVLDILRMSSEKVPQTEIAKRKGVSRSTVQHVLYGKVWSHVTEVRNG